MSESSLQLRTCRDALPRRYLSSKKSPTHFCCTQTAWGGVKYGSRRQLFMTAEMLNHRASPFSAGEEWGIAEVLLGRWQTTGTLQSLDTLDCVWAETLGGKRSCRTTGLTWSHVIEKKNGPTTFARLKLGSLVICKCSFTQSLFGLLFPCSLLR